MRISRDSALRSRSPVPPPLFIDTVDDLAKNVEEPAQRLTQQIHRCLSRNFYVVEKPLFIYGALNDTFNQKHSGTDP